MKKVIVLYLLVCFAMLLLTQCYPDKAAYISSHPVHHDLTDSFNSLSRVEQIKLCGSCHQSAYENEMKGPHANAYLMVEEHIRFINSGLYEDSSYIMMIENVKEHCKGCHAMPNLYETILKEPNRNKDSLEKYIHGPKNPNSLTAREGGLKSMRTGDDCLTCHYNGKNVVTNVDFKRSTHSPSFCSPAPSALFSSNENCITCHLDETKGMVTTLNGKVIEQNCMKCHQEYDKNGKGTHYMYWRNDPKDKVKPSHLNIFTDIQIKYEKEKGQAIVMWENTKLPHPISICTQSKATILFTDAKNNSVGKGEIILNRRAEHSKDIHSFFEGKAPIGGKNGCKLPTDGSTLNDTIVFPKKIQYPPIKATIIGTQKAQYWFPDSFEKVMARREIILAD